MPQPILTPGPDHPSTVTPHDAVAEIAGYLAFYPDRVDITQQP